MKMTLQKISKKSMVFAMALGVFATSCTKENPTAPNLPPSTSMSMDNSFSGAANKTESGIYYGLSALAVGHFNTILAVNLAVPVASFKEAFKHEAVYDVNKKEWVWSYNVVSGVTYTAKLHASLDGDNVKWSMLVSQENGFQDFEWYTGVSKKDGSAGTWSLNKAANAKVAYIQIEWSKDATAGTSQTKFTHVEPVVGNGNYILWKSTADAEFNRYYDIYKDQALTQIMWNSSDRHGKVIDSGNASHCWNTVQEDGACQ